MAGLIYWGWCALLFDHWSWWETGLSDDSRDLVLNLVVLDSFTSIKHMTVHGFKKIDGGGSDTFDSEEVSGSIMTAASLLDVPLHSLHLGFQLELIVE